MTTSTTTILDTSIGLRAALASATASRWRLVFVRVFGSRRQITDPCGDVVLSKWRGRDYLVDYTPSTGGTAK